MPGNTLHSATLELSQKNILYSNFDGFIPLKEFRASNLRNADGFISSWAGGTTNQISKYPDAVVSLCPQGNLIFLIRNKTVFLSLSLLSCINF